MTANFFVTGLKKLRTRPQKENSTAKLTNSQEAEDARTKKLRNEIEQITLAAKGRVGVAEVVLESGETVSLNREDGEAHFTIISIQAAPPDQTAPAPTPPGKSTVEAALAE